MATTKVSTEVPRTQPRFSTGKPVPSELLDFVRSRSAATDTQISQLELELVISLRERSRDLAATVAAAEGHLRLQLESGWSIEPGKHSAELTTTIRRYPSWLNVCRFLATQLKYEWDSFYETVLANTEPKKTVSLTVR